MTDPELKPQPFEDSPSDCLTGQVVTPPENQPVVAWGVLIVYPYQGPRLLGFDTKEECDKFRESYSRETYTISVSVPTK